MIDVQWMILLAAKSVVITALALLAVLLLRKRSAFDRAAVLRLATILLAALPLIAIAAPSVDLEVPALAAGPSLSEVHGLPLVHLESAAPGLENAVALPDRAAPISPLFLMLIAGAGAAVMIGRLLIGIAILRRWSRGATAVEDPTWLDARQRLGGNRVALRLSDDIRSPISWGWRQPVILLDRASLGRRGAAEAILAHELANVSRRDWPVLVLSRVVRALFWFNPLVWTVDRLLGETSEEAADAMAIGRVEPLGYAEALLACLRQGAGRVRVPANAMAARNRSIGRRVRRLIEVDREFLARRSRLVLATLLVAVAAAVPLSLLRLVPPAEAAVAEVAPTTQTFREKDGTVTVITRRPGQTSVTRSRTTVDGVPVADPHNPVEPLSPMVAEHGLRRGAEIVESGAVGSGSNGLGRSPAPPVPPLPPVLPAAREEVEREAAALALAAERYAEQALRDAERAVRNAELLAQHSEELARNSAD